MCPADVWNDLIDYAFSASNTATRHRSNESRALVNRFLLNSAPVYATRMSFLFLFPFLYSTAGGRAEREEAVAAGFGAEVIVPHEFVREIIS